LLVLIGTRDGTHGRALCPKQRGAVFSERCARASRKHDVFSLERKRLIRFPFTFHNAAHVESVVEIFNEIDGVRAKRFDAVSFDGAAQNVKHACRALAVRIHSLVNDFRDKPHFLKTRNSIVRVEFVEKFFNETRLVVMHDVHIEICEIALSVARCKQLLPHSVVAFENGDFK